MSSRPRNRMAAARRRIGAKNKANPTPEQIPTVLVVDDDPGVTRGLQRALRKDAVVLIAGGGREAIETLGQSPAVDAVVLDITMPQFDSVETLEAMSQKGHFIPIILFTGFSEPLMQTVKNYASFLKLDVIRTLEKPVNPSAIIDAITLRKRADNVSPKFP